MSNPNIARILKYYRKKNNLSVQNVADSLSERSHNSVSPKTIYGWENGTSQPTADTLMYLCELYQIHDVLTTFGYEGDTSKREFLASITEEEIQLIEAYRTHPDLHDAIKRLLELD